MARDPDSVVMQLVHIRLVKVIGNSRHLGGELHWTVLWREYLIEMLRLRDVET